MVLYFSGTGNSRYVACELARLLNNAEPVCVLDIKAVDLSDCDRLVWVFPVYSWGVPPVVVRIIEQLCLPHAVPCWLVCTCGDDVGLAPEQWRSLIESAGGKARGAFSVEMPNTYIALPGFDVDSSTLEQRKLKLAPVRIERIASAIVADSDVIDVVRGRFPWLKSHVIYPWFIRHAMSPRPFFSTDACVGCGRCERECPMANIHLDSDRRPKWGCVCAFCLRCYHACPSNAIGYGKFTKGKGQYLCPL